MPRNNTNPLLLGEKRDMWNIDGFKFAQYAGQLALGGAASVVATAGQIPANFVPLASALRCDVGGVTLTTALRLCLGLAAANPMSLCVSGLSMAAQAQTIQPFAGPGMIFSNTVIGTAGGVSSAAAFTLSTFSGQTVTPIPANTLKPGDKVRIKGGGTIAWGTDGTFILKVLGGSGGTDILYQSPTVTPADGDIFEFDVEVTIRSIGAGGSTTAGAFTSIGRSFIGTAGSLTTSATGTDVTSSGILALTALDTTAAFTPTVTGIFSTSQAAHGATMNQFSIEVIRQKPWAMTPVAAFPLITCTNNAGVLTGTGVGNVSYFIWGYELATLPASVN